MLHNSNGNSTMSKIVLNKDQYIFNAPSRTITIIGFTLTKENLFLVTNTTTNTILYNFACDGFGGEIDDNILTLQTSASSQNTDSLQIIVHQKDEETFANSSTKLNQYTQIDLLNLIYEELQIQTKLLKKIYQ
jgi:hypothetical protein